MPVSAQPADEFERRLGEALEQAVDQREGLPGFLQFRFLLFQSFLSALDFRRVFHALLLLPILQEQQEVVDDGHKVRLHLLDGRVPTTDGRELLLVRRTEPDQEVALLLARLNLTLPPQPPPAPEPTQNRLSRELVVVATFDLHTAKAPTKSPRPIRLQPQ